MGLSIGLDTAVKALRAHQLVVDAASHNIANANTPGFSRQRVLLRPIGIDGSDHASRDSLLGRVGFGVDAHDVTRVRDIFLDFQARQGLGARSFYTAYNSAVEKTELAFNDPSDDGLSALFGKFWNAWHDVVNDPESSASRTTLVNATTTLTTRIQRAFTQITTQRLDLNHEVGAVADKLNQASSEIAAINIQIKQVELSGDKANDLRDRRDLLLDQLSEYAQVSYSEQPDRTVSIYLGNHELVTGNTARDVQAIADPANPGMNKLVFKVDSADVTTTTGELRGLLDGRDTALPLLLNKLDQLTVSLIASVNAVHSVGFGLDGSTGLAFFSGTGASDVAINAVLSGTPAKIAGAGAAGLPGDGSIALLIADLQLANTMTGATETFDQYYGNMVSVLGADVNRAKGAMESSQILVDHMDGLRQSVAGVSIDEEVTNMNAAQHAYNAAAKVISTIDGMLDTLINRTGAR
jgi:flagellar hook-associated protein 1 FlgK